MKPFNLEAAKAGAKLVARDGREVIDFHHFAHDQSKLCVCAHIKGQHGPEWFDKSGASTQRDGDESASDHDLFMATVERTVYVNLWKARVESDRFSFAPDGARVGHWFDTESEALAAATDLPGEVSPHCIAAAVPVTISE